MLLTQHNTIMTEITRVTPGQINESTVIDDVNSFEDESGAEVIEQVPAKPHVYVIHHCDADGWAAGAIAMATLASPSIEMSNYPTQYGKPLPIDINVLTDKDAVFILDFSYDREILEDINKRVKSLVVLDHHESMREKIADLPYVTFDLTKSGVLLAWEHFVDPSFVPPNIQLLDAYDLWNKNHPEYSWDDIASFHLGCVPRMDELGFWLTIVNGFLLNHNVMATGRELYKDVVNRAEELKSDVLSSQFKVRDTNIFFCHNKLHISLVSDLLYNDETLNCPVTVMAFETDDGWVLSIRSKSDSPLSALEIAKVFNGGGHVLAAGGKINEQIGQTDLEAYVARVLWEKLGR